MTLVGLGLVGAGLGAQTQSATYDLLISNGQIVDGSGAPWWRGDIGVTADRIVAMGDLHSATARTRVDATGLVVAPGFIDMLGQSEFNVLVDGRAASKIMQGVTTEITGEGASIAPGERPHARGPEGDLRALQGHRRTGARSASTSRGSRRGRIRRSTSASFVGAGGVRDYVIGRDDRPATPAELDADEGGSSRRRCSEGALGLSSSLQYVPDRFASTDELVELAKVAASYGGIYITHQRSESGKIFESLDEVFAIAERANIPAEIWHLKTAYKANWGKMPEVLARIRRGAGARPRRHGQQYPYTRAVERARRVPAALGARRRHGRDDRAAEGSRRSASASERDMDDPNVDDWENQWYGSGGGDGVMLAAVLESRPAQVRGHDAHARSARRWARTRATPSWTSSSPTARESGVIISIMTRRRTCGWP